MRIVGDKPIAEIDDTVIVHYLETLQKLPANMNKSPMYVGKTIEEIVGLAAPPMAARSVNKNVERVSSIFKWALSKTKYGINLGAVVANMQSLEFYIRCVLSELPGSAPHGLAENQNIYDCQIGYELLDSPMTNFDSLGQLISKYNSAARDFGWHSLDAALVAVRDALAHGRVAYSGDEERYQTRHTFASMMLSAGEHPMWVAQQMGHADWTMLLAFTGAGCQM